MSGTGGIFGKSHSNPRQSCKIEVKRLSSIYETEPVGYTDQGEFLNMVIAVQTSLRPETLLHQCLQVEFDLGREREFKWGPRIIDLDVLLYEKETIETADLLIPTRGCKKSFCPHTAVGDRSRPGTSLIRCPVGESSGRNT
ncbi:2-amino-4-hydroxy-6-hydroxymethyldihydropteridine diphosphokinase [Rossellomorea marisflavi]|nr:2-amino-4-hydroxy-6-hydroxymethyldihydropteridine diphosphokinase [Rossellomorea marisflavi]MDW4528932.1 2-amino-4-hydroxy-6-hydroxymethyldihydropteridine diphosphokinase [Rossellomorea marisflavi]